MRAPLKPLAAAPIFYRLPYAFRRALLRTFRPQKFLAGQRMRQEQGEYSYHPFDERRCIFVHIPKTGGVSVSRALFGNLAGGHATIRDYQMAFSREEFHAYFKFAFVRNPWDRLYSAFHFLRSGGMNERDAEWSRRHLSSFDSFDSFVLKWLSPDNIYLYDHFVPQTDFIRLPGDTNVSVDFVGRFEQLETDFLYVCNRIGCPSQLTHENKVAKDKGAVYKDAYSSKTRLRVASIYRNDLDAFGYEF